MTAILQYSNLLRALWLAVSLMSLAAPFFAHPKLEKSEAESKNGGRKQAAALNDQAENNQDKSPQKALEFAQKALEQARLEHNQAEEARAMINLGECDVVGAKYKEAISFGENSAALAKKLNNKRLLPRALNLLGKAHRWLNNPVKAAEYHRQALQISIDNGDKANQADSLNHLGISYRALGDKKKALETQLQALKLREELGGKQAIALSLNSVGISYKNLGEYDKAIESYQRALKIREELGDKQAASNLLNNLGILYQIQNDYQKSLEVFLKALKIKEELNDKKGIIFLSNSVGNLYYSLEQTDRALEAYQRALQINEELGDKGGVAMSLSNLGITYVQKNHHEKALEVLTKALPLARESGQKNLINVILINTGLAHLKLGKYEKAIENSLQALRAIEELGDKNAQAVLLENVGMAYTGLGKYAEAVENLHHALNLAKALDSKFLLRNIYGSLSETYVAQKNFEKALDNEKKFNEMANSLVSEDAKKEMGRLQIQYDTEKKQKEIEILKRDKQIQKLELTRQQLELLRQRDHIQDLQREREMNRLAILAKEQDLKMLESEKQIESLELAKSQMESEKQAKKIELLQKDAALQTSIRNSLLIGFACIGVIALVLTRLYFWQRQVEGRLKKKNEEITTQKELLEKQAAEIERTNSELEQAALTDSLTGLRNRRFYSFVIGNEVARVQRSYQPEAHESERQDLLFYLLDIDHFKQINDRYGHDAGDFVLVEIARRLQETVRKSDYLLRWGGEEFLMISREVPRQEAHNLAERVIKAVASEPITMRSGERLSITLSVGWSAFPYAAEPSDLSTPEDSLKMADRALYLAKEMGRNRAIGVLSLNNDADRLPENLLLADGKSIKLVKSAERLLV